jgi:hypothetical protein
MLQYLRCMSMQFTPEQWEQWFDAHPIPTGFQLDSGSRITDPKQFLSTQIALLRHYGENAMQGKLCRDKLLRVKELLEKQEAKP